MNKKILILLIGFLISSVNAINTDDIFTKLIYNTDNCIDNCIGIYEKCNPFPLIVTTDIKVSNIKHNFYFGELIKENPLLIEKTIDEEYNCIVKTYSEEICNYHFNISKEICYNKTINDYGICKRKVTKFVEPDINEEIPYGECRNIMISGSIGLNNVVEWIPEVTINGITYKQNKWDYWNSTIYGNSWEIFNFTEGEGYSLNGSSGANDNYFYANLGGGNNYLVCIESEINENCTVVNESSEMPNFNSRYCLGNNLPEVYNITAFYSLNEGEGNQTLDCSGVSNDGMCNGFSNQLCNWTSGVIGTGIKFDGLDDYIYLTSKVTLTSSWSIEFWFKADDTAKQHCIMGDGGSDNNIRLSCGAGYFHIEGSGDCECTIVYACDTNWHHGIILQNGTNVYVFIDGAVIGADSICGSTTIGIQYIADKLNWAGSYFNGTLDEVRLYDFELSGVEIEELYQTGINNRTQLGEKITINKVPNVILNYPSDNSTNISRNPILNVTVIDNNEDVMNVTFYNSSDNSVICFNESIIDGSLVFCEWNNLSFNTTYEWLVNVTDGINTTSSPIWNFSTEFSTTTSTTTTTTIWGDSLNYTGLIRVIIIDTIGKFENRKIFICQNSSGVTRYIKTANFSSVIKLGNDIHYEITIEPKGYDLITSVSNNKIFNYAIEYFFYIALLISIILIISYALKKGRYKR